MRVKFDKHRTLSMLVNKIGQNYFCSSIGFDGFYSPCIYVFMSRFRRFLCNVASKPFNKAIKWFSFYGRRLYGIFIDAYTVLFLKSLSKIKTAISIYVASAINILLFHIYNITGKQKEDQDPQRLSGLEFNKFVKLCDSPNLFERLGGRNNKTPRQKWSVGFTPKVTDSRQTEDQLTRDMLASTASFINCVGGVNGDNPTELTRSDVDEVVRQLLGNNAYTILDNIEGEDKFGTAPVRDAYFALCNTDLTKELDSVAGFIQKNQYPSPMDALRSEWGAVGNLRFLVSSIGSVSPNASANGSDVYNIFCVGMEAYACIEQDGYSASFIYRPPIYDGPLALNASVGFKFAEVPRITNDLWVLNLRCTLS